MNSKPIYKSVIVWLSALGITASGISVFDYLPDLIVFLDGILNALPLLQGTKIDPEKLVPYVTFAVSILVLVDRIFKTNKVIAPIKKIKSVEDVIKKF